MKIQDQYDPTIRKLINEYDQTALIPIGSLEQHGSHLPISTDSDIISRIAKTVSKKCGFLLLPLLMYGCSKEHSPYFNISLKNTTLQEVLADICFSLYKNNINKIIILNGHYGNMRSINNLKHRIDKMHKGKISLIVLSYWKFMEREFDHAGFVETSLMLAISNKTRVNMVKKGIIVNNLSKKARLKIKRLLTKSFPIVTKSGIIGDPTGANAKDGKIILTEIIKNLIKSIKFIK